MKTIVFSIEATPEIELLPNVNSILLYNYARRGQLVDPDDKRQYLAFSVYPDAPKAEKQLDIKYASKVQGFLISTADFYALNIMPGECHIPFLTQLKSEYKLKLKG